MPSRHLVDPQILGFVEAIPTFDFKPGNLDQNRAMMAAFRPPPAAASADVTVSEHMIAGPDGAPEVRVLVSAPASSGQLRPGILHIHGGGFIMGAADDTLVNDEAYVRNLGAVVVSVDYRLAPETPFPGPVEDCYAALVWLHAQASVLGVDPARLVVTGESAGGGLAAATVLLARDRGQVPIAFQHLIFPMLDDRTVTRSDPSAYLGQYVWTPTHNLFGWTSLLGKAPGGPDVSPYAAPARATDLSGLPPTFMICGALDLFLEEDMDYATRLIRAGVATEFHVYPGAPHAFMMAAQAEITKAFGRDSMTALAKALGVTGS